MPARDAEWKVIVKYFTDNKAEGEGLGVVLKRTRRTCRTMNGAPISNNSHCAD